LPLLGVVNSVTIAPTAPPAKNPIRKPLALLLLLDIINSFQIIKD
jgi:hypothetical protein